jgi:hypothetical protein
MDTHARVVGGTVTGPWCSDRAKKFGYNVRIRGRDGVFISLFDFRLPIALCGSRYFLIKPVCRIHRKIDSCRRPEQPDKDERGAKLHIHEWSCIYLHVYTSARRANALQMIIAIRRYFRSPARRLAWPDNLGFRDT